MKLRVNFSGKKILLFVPQGDKGRYGSQVKTELCKHGAVVLTYPERPSNSTFTKLALRLSKHIFPSVFNSYIKQVIKETNNVDFDFVLVVRGEAFNPKSTYLLRKAFPKAYLILYIWDILATNDVTNIIPHFDRVLTFDSKDVQVDKKMIFRPLFYLESHKNIIQKSLKQTDVFFAGTIHSVRYKVLKSVEEYLKRRNKVYYFYFFLPSKLNYLMNIVKGNYPISTRISEFQYTLMPSNILNDEISKSKSIIDIAHPQQHSLSMRTMEALGSSTKLITDYKGIVNYDFYNQSNIVVIDKDKLEIPDSFFMKEYEKVNDDIFKKYSLVAWLEDVFDVDYDCSNDFFKFS